MQLIIREKPSSFSDVKGKEGPPASLGAREKKGKSYVTIEEKRKKKNGIPLRLEGKACSAAAWEGVPWPGSGLFVGEFTPSP